jgi:hypothetical protein
MEENIMKKQSFIYLVYNGTEHGFRTALTQITGINYTTKESQKPKYRFVDEDGSVERIPESLARRLMKSKAFRKLVSIEYQDDIYVESYSDPIYMVIKGTDLEDMTGTDSQSFYERKIEDLYTQEIKEKLLSLGYKYYVRYPIVITYKGEFIEGTHKANVIKIMDLLRQAIADNNLDIKVWASKSECKTIVHSESTCQESVE